MGFRERIKLKRKKRKKETHVKSIKSSNDILGIPHKKVFDDDKINFYLCPASDSRRHVSYKNNKVNIIDFTYEKCSFMTWSKRNGKHHWLPSEAVRFGKRIAMDLGLDFDINKCKCLNLNADGKMIKYYVPDDGEFEYHQYNGIVTTGDSSILYGNPNRATKTEYHYLNDTHCISTIVNKSINGPSLLVIGDSMAVPIVLAFASVCSKITYIDNRHQYDISMYNLHDYDKVFAIMVNNVGWSVNKFVCKTLDYFVNQI